MFKMKLLWLLICFVHLVGNANSTTLAQTATEKETLTTTLAQITIVNTTENENLTTTPIPLVQIVNTTENENLTTTPIPLVPGGYVQLRLGVTTWYGGVEIHSPGAWASQCEKPADEKKYGAVVLCTPLIYTQGTYETVHAFYGSDADNFTVKGIPHFGDENNICECKLISKYVVRAANREKRTVPVLFVFDSSSSFTFRLVNIAYQSTDFSTTATLSLKECAKFSLYDNQYKKNDTALELLVSEDNEIRGTVEMYHNDDCEKTTRTYVWFMWQVDENDNETQALEYNPSNDSLYIKFDANSVAIALYKLRLNVTVTFPGGTYFVMSDDIYIHFKPTPLMSELLEGSIRFVGTNAPLHMMPDPETVAITSINNTIPLTQTWICWENTDPALTSDALAISFAQLLNGDTTIDSIVATWAPRADVIDVNGTVTTSLLTPGTWYIVILQLQRGISETTAMAFQGLQASTVTTKITCLQNCLPKAVTNNRLALQATCEGCGDPSTTYMFYYWSVMEYDIGTLTFVTVDTTEMLETSLNTNTLALKPAYLKSGSLYRFMVTLSNNVLSSNAEYIIKIDEPPYGGNCIMNPTTGEAAVTFYSIICSNWKDEYARHKRDPSIDIHEPLLYEVYQTVLMKSENKTFVSFVTHSRSSTMKFLMGVGNKEDAYRMIVTIRIFDFFHSVAEVNFTAQATNPISLPPSIETVSTFFDEALKVAEMTRDYARVTNLHRSIITVLNDLPIENTTIYTTEEDPQDWDSGLIDNGPNGTKPFIDLIDNLLTIKKDTVLDANKKIASTMSNMSLSFLKSTIANFSSVSDIKAFAFTSVDMISSDNTTTNSMVLEAVETLRALVEKFDETVLSQNQATAETIDALYMICNNLLDVTIKSSLQNMTDALSIRSTVDGIEYVDFLAKVHRDEAYQAAEISENTPEERVGLFTFRSKLSRLDFSYMQDRSSKSLTAITDLIDGISTVVQKTLCQGCSNTYSTPLIIQTLSNLVSSNLTVAVQGLNVYFETQERNETNPLFIITSVYERNPFVSGNSTKGSMITSKVCRVITKDPIRNETQQSEVTVSYPLSSETSGSFISHFVDDTKCFYHEAMYRNNKDFVCIRLGKSSTNYFQVYISLGSFPNHMVYEKSLTLSPSNNRTSCIPPLRKTGIVKICLRPEHITSEVTEPQNSSIGNNRTESGFHYDLTIATTNCLSWDSASNDWHNDDNSCEVIWQPDKGQIVCKCLIKKEMIVGTSFFVPPNTIDFSSVFLKLSPLDQFWVMTLIIVVIIVFVFLLYWSTQQDKLDMVRWGVTPLIDNDMNHMCFYLMTIHTGFRSNAGTTSRINFTLVGCKEETDVRLLTDGIRKEFKSGSVIRFLLTTERSLGELDYICLWLDLTEQEAIDPWFLKMIDVEDLQNKRRYFFPHNKWLFTEENNLQCTIPDVARHNLLTFRNKLYQNCVENITEFHVLTSLFCRPFSSHFTRAQRTACLLLFVTMSMITNAFYFKPMDDYENNLLMRLGPLVFSLQSVYVSLVSVVISIFSVFLVVFLFKKSKPKQDHRIDAVSKSHFPMLRFFMKEELKECKELELRLVAKGFYHLDGACFPYCFKFVAWILSLSGSVAALYFLFLYSVEWGKQKSEMWLTQFLLAFIGGTIFIEPLKTMMIAVLFAAVFNQSDRVKPSPLTRKIILKNYREQNKGDTGHSSMYMSIPKGDKVVNAIKNYQRKRTTFTAMKEFTITSIFVWVIYSISFANRDERFFAIQNGVSSSLVSSSLYPGFSEIITTKDYMNWLTNTTFPTIFPQTDYTNETLHWRWRQYFSDLCSFRVGPPRLRQLRINHDEKIYPFVGKVPYYSSYSLTNEATADYCIGWQTPPCDLKNETYSFSTLAWKHTRASDIWGSPVDGHYAMYDGGGYIAELDVNLYFSKKIMSELQSFNWIDRHTRAVFFEFTLYSANLNVFTYSMFLTEFPETGGTLRLHTIYPFRIYLHHGHVGMYTLYCEIIFCFCMFLLMLRILGNLFLHTTCYLADYWRVVDLLMFVLGLVSMALYFARLFKSYSTMEIFAEQPKRFVNFQHLMLWDQYFILSMSCLVFATSFRILGVFGYDTRIGIVFKIIKRCVRDIGCFGILFLYVLFGYACFGYLIFGRESLDYRSPFHGLQKLFLSLLGKRLFSYSGIVDPIATAYFFAFAIIVVFFLMTIFLIILCESIDAVKNDESEDKQDLAKLLWDGLRQVVAKKKERPRRVKQEKKKSERKQTSIELLQDLRKNIDCIVLKLRCSNTGSPDVSQTKATDKAETQPRQHFSVYDYI